MHKLGNDAEPSLANACLARAESSIGSSQLDDVNREMMRERIA